MDALSILTDAELASMTDRAYREAARSWSDARRFPDLAILADAARSAEDYWRTLRDEQARRHAGYAGQSPFVRRAKAGELPAKVVQ